MPSVKWVRYTTSGETVIRTGGRFVVGSVFRNLYIFHLQWSDAGKYGCVAQNKHGRAEANFYITVQTGMQTLKINIMTTLSLGKWSKNIC